MEFLDTASSVLGEWVTVQTAWQYMERIFGTEELRAQLPVECDRFDAVNSAWHSVVTGAVADPCYVRVLKLPGGFVP